MYIPTAFRIEDAEKLASFMRRYSFATLVTSDGSAPFASHLPVLHIPEADGQGRLVSHMARANPQWQHFASGAEVLVMFHGPHGYVSPSWYVNHPAVPTWNYAAVHACGVPRVIEDHARIVELLRETVVRYESGLAQPWSGELPEEFRDKLVRGIVAFEIPISRLEGKFKLNQNRAPEDIRGVITALESSGDADDLALARLMAVECGISPE